MEKQVKKTSLREKLWQFRNRTADEICREMGKRRGGILCAVLLGDSFYGDGPELGISRTALHAQQLTFTHPFCEKVMRIESEMPKDLSFLLR